MAGNSGIAAGRLQLKNNADSNDCVMAWSSQISNVVITPVGNLFANSVLTVNTLILLQNGTPANSSTYVQGQLWSDGNYIYYAVTNSIVKSVALTLLVDGNSSSNGSSNNSGNNSSNGSSNSSSNGSSNSSSNGSSNSSSNGSSNSSSNGSSNSSSNGSSNSSSNGSSNSSSNGSSNSTSNGYPSFYYLLI